ncbi:MAG: hypothetical protein WDZ40_01840 [Candidatus Spechtbacterales bacterium]
MDAVGFIPHVLYAPVSVLLTLFAAYLVGVVVTTSAADWLLSRVFLVRKVWSVVKVITDRITFVFKGGYKRVVYEHFGADTKRWRPAIVIGRTMFHNPDGTQEPMLIVNQPPPNVFDPLWIPAKDTRIIEDDVKTFSLYIFSGGFVNPADLHLSYWTEEEYEEIPASTE